MPLHVYDGTAWRSVTDPSVYDGTAWRTITALHVYDGTAWREVFVRLAITGFEEHALDGPSNNWRGRVINITNAGAESIRVETRINGSGGFTYLETLNTTPDSGTVATSFVFVDDGSFIEFRLTPYPENAEGGAAGPSVIVLIDEGFIT